MGEGRVEGALPDVRDPKLFMVKVIRGSIECG